MIVRRGWRHIMAEEPGPSEGRGGAVIPPKAQPGALYSLHRQTLAQLGLHLVLALCLLLLAYGIAKSAFNYGRTGVADAVSAVLSGDRDAICIGHDEERGRKPTTATAQYDVTTLANLLLPNLNAYQASPAEKQRILDQALKAQRLACMHADVLGRYVGDYYMAILVSVVFSGITAVALFIVGPKGWTASNPYIINVLILSGAIAAFYGAFPTLFQQAAMTTAHKAQLLRYEGLLDGMASHIATPRLVPRACTGQDELTLGRIRNEPFPVVEFIACTDAALAALDLPFAFDPAHGPDYQIIGGTAGRR
jgi:hypothetical protein